MHVKNTAKIKIGQDKNWIEHVKLREDLQASISLWRKEVSK